MRVYNTLTRKKEEFIPMEVGDVKMYACGITVSGDAHIGHAYQALIYDIIRKYLEKRGYGVKYARNYTDVDDKIIAKSRETGIPADEYAAMMIAKIDHEMRELQVDDPTLWLKATESIGDIIHFVEGLIAKGYAYATKNGDVYYSVSKFGEYGKLSGRTLEDTIDGVRIENDEEKDSPMDFALWKSAKEGEISWDSPWGAGRPGWHIECSAMNMVAFGEQIDIHGGGRDLIFPHHENEIAQTEALTGKQFCRYWLHNGLIKVNGQKMSKSLGNSLLLSDLLKNYNPETIKFALLQTSYHNDINVNDSLFPDAEKHLFGFYNIILQAKTRGFVIEGENKSIDERFDRAMDDDFNTALALSDLFGIFKEIKRKLEDGDKTAGADIAQVKKTYGLLGLFRADEQKFVDSVQAKEVAQQDAVPAEIRAKAEQRLQAKRDKNWAVADALRAEILAAGYEIKDIAGGNYTLSKMA